MSDSADKDLLIQKLLQERDELYGELSRLRKADNGAFEASEKENKRLLKVVEKKDEKIDKLTDTNASYGDVVR
jgi:hypothetical protein